VSAAGPGRLSGKVAAVTGAGSGIGRAIAAAFAREGAVVLLAGRRPAPVASAAGAIVQSGGTAVAVPGDMSREEEVARLVLAAHAAFGPIDILVNNAGAMVSRSDVAGCTQADWMRTMDLNLHTAYQCSRQVLPDLVKTSGSILNIASVFGLFGAPQAAAYSAAKGALVSLTRAMAVDFGKSGIRVNAICPAYVETDLNRDLLDRLRANGEFTRILERLPLGHIGETDDVANAAVFLSSHEAKWITGIALPVDGGMSAGVNGG
jgi:meso-butanediol dehydrogenase / (S,S)-butanediol dehydrogenase / diacetyl reductase